MGIRIDCHFNGSKTVISIAGRFCGTGVQQLEQACAQVEGPCVLDLSNLVFADNDGIDAIRAIIAKGVQVHGASPFIALLLDDASS